MNKSKKLLCIGLVLLMVCVHCCGYADILNHRKAQSMYTEFKNAYKQEDYARLTRLVNKNEDHIIDETVEATFDVKESQMIRSVNGRMLGIGYETGFMDPNNFFEKGTTTLSAEYLDIAEQLYDFPVARLGGHYSNYDNYLHEIGEMGNRRRAKRHSTAAEYNAKYVPGSYQPFDRENTIGPEEFVRLTQAINPDVEYIITLPFLVCEPEECVKIVQFFMDEADESEFGALRASLGLVEPINVLAFELGNELYITELSPNSYNNPRTAQKLIKDSKEVIFACKELCPEAKFSVPLRLNAQIDGESWHLWSDWMAEGLGQYIDYASPHMYYGGWAYNFWQDWIPTVYESFRKAGAGHIKFLLTEHGKWYGENDDKNFDTHTLYSTLTVSHFLSVCYELPYVEGATYYQYRNSSWAIVKRLNNDFLIMGMPQMYGVWLDNLGDRVVKSELKSDSRLTDRNHGDCQFFSVAMANGDDELILFLTNRAAYANFNMKFSFENEYTLVEETVFTAPNIYSFVANKKTQDIFETRVTQMNVENFSEYLMPSKSLVVLHLKKQP